MIALENLLYTVENGICTLVINRPDKLNALNRKTIEEIGAAIKQAEADTSVTGIIITGAGSKSFVAGADISEFIGLNPLEGQAMAQYGQDVFRRIERCTKPVIAAVNGFALGGGCELAMACHLRLASENAKFGQPEVNLGLIPGYGGTQRLIQYIGKTKATEFLMTADLIGSAEALSLGLVNYVVPSDQLLPKCLELLEKIRAKAPLAITGVIRSVDAYYTDGIDGFKAEVSEFGKCFSSEDVKEGTAAFLEKRKATFKGK
jgi:enoyl-CoA hydratase